MVAVMSLFLRDIPVGGSRMRLFGWFGDATKLTIIGFMVLGLALLDSVQQSMRQTVTSSLAGDLQVYSTNAEDQLALFGEALLGGDDIGEMPDFAKVREAIEPVDNVRAVVPMGITSARFVMGNRIDELIASLRKAVSQDDWKRVEKLRSQLESMADELQEEAKKNAKIASDPSRFEEQVAALERVQSDAFWREDLREKPTESLQFLDTQIAPLASEGRLVFLRLLGTDPERFVEYFDRFQVEDGQRIPEGERGVMISKRTYEDFLKNEVAEELDRIREELREEERVIAEDETLQNQIKRLQKQYQRITFGLPPERASKILDRVREFLGRSGGTSKEVLMAFLDLTDENFERRYEFFYDEIAPLMDLYAFEIGETVTVQAFSDRGFARSANVKIWGTYSFAGLEDSDLSGSVNLVDLMTF